MIDTNLDDKDSRPVTAPAVLDTADGDFDGVTPSIPPTPAVLTRYDRLDAKEEVKDPPMVKLLKNLTTGKAKRELTCVQFGEKSPTIAVGDNNGSVLVYRIYDPVTITHEGPMQQTSKLKAAILRQVDPAISNHLISIEEETQTN